MEDFGSILWIIALAALVFGSGSKGRKKAKEAAKRAIRQLEEEGRRHEAWPSWDLPERQDAQQTVRPTEHPDRSQAQGGSTSRHPEDHATTTPWPVIPDLPTAAPHHLPPPAAVEIESTHDDPDRDRTGTLKVGTPYYDEHEEVSATGQATPITGYSTAPAVGRGTLRKNAAHDTADRLPEEPANETAEEFDLRRAIIYSEILKPKFEEL